MDISQAVQEIRRLRGLVETRQISPEVFAQAINALQISDASGSYWHVDGATLRWYRFNGQTWVEQAPPLPPAPTLPPGGYYGQAPTVAGAAPGRSLLPLWIGLGVLAALVLILTGALLSGALRPAVNNPPLPEPTAVATTDATRAVTATTRLETAAPATPKPATATLAPAPSATKPPAATPTVREITATRPPLPTPTTALSAANFLLPNGPWLLSKDEANLYLIQAAKTVTLNSEKLVAPSSLAAMIAPHGGYLAFITSPDPGGMRGLKLTIYNVAALKVEKVIPLTSAKTDPGVNAKPGDAAFEAVRSITDFDSLAWSPDGRRLAFIGVQDGPSSDLYLYSLDTQKVTRLTDGPTQGFSPTWSPDGKFIVQFGANSFGTGAGISVVGVWATHADDTGSIELYKPAASGELGLGWANANTFLVYSFNPMCGYFNLRAVSLQPVKVTPVFAGCFNSAAFDSATGSVILGITQGQADLCNCSSTKTGGGLYLLGLNGSLKQLNSADVPMVAWLKNAGAVWGYAANQGPLAFTPAGKALALPSGLPSGEPLVGTGGKTWAWTAGQIDPQPGLWIGAPDSAVQKVSDLPISAAAWNAQATALIFLNDAKLYVAAAPAFKPQFLANTSSAYQLEWVSP